jgi:hypothetical protein
VKSLEGLAMSAIGISAGEKAFAVSAHAVIRHEDLYFERQQSLALRNLEWEDRIRPPLSWIALIVRGLGIVILACAMLAILI